MMGSQLETLSLIRQAYENCARTAEARGSEEIANAIRKLGGDVKATPAGLGIQWSLPFEEKKTTP